MNDNEMVPTAPAPFHFPILFHQPEPRPRERGPRPEDYVPPRVSLAMQFLAALSAKTRAEAVRWGPMVVSVDGVGGADIPTGGVEVVPGQKLTEEEQSAQASACNLLSQYFAGKVPATKLEKAAERRGRRGKRPLQGAVVDCMTCRGHALHRMTCGTCHGSGKVMIEYAPVR